jgi:hypothetical protein
VLSDLLHVLTVPARSTAGCAWNEFIFALVGVCGVGSCTKEET